MTVDIREQQQQQQTPFDSKRVPRNILVVSCDLPSHPYAAAKLATVYASAGHRVTLASPEGPAFDRCKRETQGAPGVYCITIGAVATEKHMSERPVTDPHSWRTLYESLKEPFYLATAVNLMFDEQEGLYAPLRNEIERGGYDLVIGMHSTAALVADAAESVQNETGKEVPVAIFSSLPYDPAIFMGEWKAWNHPRTLSTFPHITTYSANPPNNIFRRLVQTGWRLLDAWLTTRAWARSAPHNNARRARRGLGPIPNGWQGYIQKYPGICFGGVYPFLDPDSPVAPHVTAIGYLESSPSAVEGDLKLWLGRRAAEHGIVYASFGTGTELSEDEAAAITGDVVRSLEVTPYPMLIALRASEQRKLRAVFDSAVGSAPTDESDSHLEYLDGRLRIEADVPQSSLLSSGHVLVFLSHMGMGGFTEGCKGGVPFVCYPSGCDQFFNAQRAVDAGVAVQAPYGLANIGGIVLQVLKDDEMLARAKDVAAKLSKVNGEERALQVVDRLTAKTPDRSTGKEKVIALGPSSTVPMLSTVRERHPNILLAQAA